MKVILRSTHPNRGLFNGQEWIPAHRPAVATITALVEQRIAKGDFRVLVGNLSNDATDEELVKFLTEAGDDLQLALESFESAYSLEAARRETEDQKKERLTAEEEKRQTEVKRLQDLAAEEKRLTDEKVANEVKAPADAAKPPVEEAKKN